MPLLEEIVDIIRGHQRLMTSDGVNNFLSDHAVELGKRDQRLVIRRLAGRKSWLQSAGSGNALACLQGKPISSIEPYLVLCALRSRASVSFNTSLEAYNELRVLRDLDTLSGFPSLLRLCRTEVDAVWTHVWLPTLKKVQEEAAVANALHAPQPTRNKCFAGWCVVFVVCPGLALFQAKLQLKSVEAQGGTGIVHRAESGMLTLDIQCVRHITVAVVCPDPALARKTVSHPLRSRSFAVYKKDWVSASLRERKILSARVYAHQEATPSRSPPVYEAEKVWSQASTAAGSAILATDPPTDQPTNPPTDPPTGYAAGKRRRRDIASYMSVAGDANVAKSLEFPVSAKKPKVEGHTLSDNNPQKDARASPVCASQPANVARCADVFQCQSGVSRAKYAVTFPNNLLIIDLLEKVAAFWEVARPRDEDAKHRVINLRKTCSVIRRFDCELLSVDQVDDLVKRKDLGFIGSRIGSKLAEILNTGRLKEAEEKEASPVYAPIRELSAVWGVGPATAYGLLGMGIKCVADLRRYVTKDPTVLDQNQHIGLRRYEDLLLRIPRAEVDELDSLLKARVKSIAPDGSVRTTITGSYLRGRDSCGDVDVMVHGNKRDVEVVMAKLIKGLKTDGIITDELVDGDAKYFCVYRLRPGTPHRRLDLFAVPREEYAFALLTYTGSGKFNRSMRCRARQLGYSLSHKGINRVTRFRLPDKRQEKLVTGPAIACTREEEIFALLGIDYKSPSERDL